MTWNAPALQSGAVALVIALAFPSGLAVVAQSTVTAAGTEPDEISGAVTQ